MFYALAFFSGAVCGAVFTWMYKSSVVTEARFGRQFAESELAKAKSDLAAVKAKVNSKASQIKKVF